MHNDPFMVVQGRWFCRQSKTYGTSYIGPQ